MTFHTGHVHLAGCFFIWNVSDAVQQQYPGTPAGEIRQAMRQKCSNAVKTLKYKKPSTGAVSVADDNAD